MIQIEQYTDGFSITRYMTKKYPHSSIMSIRWQKLRNILGWIILIRGNTLLHKKSKTNMIFYEKVL